VADYQDSGNGSGRLDRIERVLELLVNNQLAIQEQHDQDFKKLMTWQVLAQDRLDELTAKIDRQSDMQAALDERVDKLVIAIGELIRSIRPPGPIPQQS
jgi:hypothetical protein